MEDKVKNTKRLCKSCKNEVERAELDANFSICPICGKNLRFHAKKRLKALADHGTFHEWDKDLEWQDVIDKTADETYAQKLAAASKKHNLNDAIITGEMDMNGHHTAIGVMDTRFMMASMGYIVGEKVTRLFERAIKKRLPVILFSCSGGARMQEGIISLMQMSKTAAMVRRHSREGLLYISVMTDPTMGGVTASFATLGDINLAEKGAMIGFTGPRVIEQNTGVKLPKGFQTAEFQLEHGFVDGILPRETAKEELARLLALHEESKLVTKSRFRFGKAQDAVLEAKLEAWEMVRAARATSRPTSRDYINALFTDFVELKGDRISRDDHAIVGGIAKFHGMTVTVIGEEKGKKSLEDAIYRNWGMPSPSGYRKALRLMEQAEKFNRPIICFVDTIGAACGMEAEIEGQGLVIAKLLEASSDIKVPFLSVIIGEGCSGGALALASGNEVWMLEKSVYSILSPEGYASILWKDNSLAAKAAQEMKLGAADLYAMKIIDKVIPEPEVYEVANMETVCTTLDEEMSEFFKKYQGKNWKAVVKDRYQHFRKY